MKIWLYFLSSFYFTTFNNLNSSPISIMDSGSGFTFLVIPEQNAQCLSLFFHWSFRFFNLNQLSLLVKSVLFGSWIYVFIWRSPVCLCSAELSSTDVCWIGKDKLLTEYRMSKTVVGKTVLSNTGNGLLQWEMGCAVIRQYCTWGSKFGLV